MELIHSHIGQPGETPSSSSSSSSFSSSSTPSPPIYPFIHSSSPSSSSSSSQRTDSSSAEQRTDGAGVSGDELPMVSLCGCRGRCDSHNPVLSRLLEVMLIPSAIVSCHLSAAEVQQISDLQQNGGRTQTRDSVVNEFSERRLGSNWEEEEGPAGNVKPGQADKFGLTELKDSLKALDDSSEIRWLTELLPLCVECQTFMSMGNQQGAGRDSQAKPPRIQIPRDRRKRAEEIVNAGALHHNIKMSPGSPRVPSKVKRPTKLQISSSPTSGEWDFQVDRPIRRKGVSVKDKENQSARTQEVKPVWRVKPPDAASEKVSRSNAQKAPLSYKRDLPRQDECASPDSDTDQSEYDNETSSAYITQPPLDSNRRTEERTGTPAKPQFTQSASQTHEDRKAEVMEVKSPQRWFEELGKRAAARRVMGKIEEVEGIIRRVSLTSSDWIKEASEGDESQFILDGSKGDDHLPQRCCAEFTSDSLSETQNQGHAAEEPLPVEELRVLCEALSQSLHQALRMEGAKADIEDLIEDKHTFCEKNSKGSKRKNRPSHLYECSNNSSRPLSLDRETSPVSSGTLSTVLDVSPPTSSSFDVMSPILSPLFSSSLPLNLTDQREEDVWQSHTVQTKSAEDSLSSGAKEKGERNPKRKWSWSSLGLGEDIQTDGRTTEAEDNRDSSSAYEMISKDFVASPSDRILPASIYSCKQTSTLLLRLHSFHCLCSGFRRTERLSVSLQQSNRIVPCLSPSVPSGFSSSAHTTLRGQANRINALSFVKRIKSSEDDDQSEREKGIQSRLRVELPLTPADEALQRLEEIWQQEVEESFSFSRFLSHPSRPKHIDFLRITAAEDDITDSPTATPLPPEVRVSSTDELGSYRAAGRPAPSQLRTHTSHTLIPDRPVYPPVALGVVSLPSAVGGLLHLMAHGSATVLSETVAQDAICSRLHCDTEPHLVWEVAV
ncbi:unnamed protein product [Pleuronectes platessa]|uniref:Uncharacterized protein n=1 Tax=Pleuronectes platessa TaxID=8262 RepID=A0A9N7TJ71_PLEPL|nr:unnamed protein product [Pleuronectes platessa]